MLQHTSVLPAQDRRVENVIWSPIARDILATSVYTSVEVIDVEAGEKKIGKHDFVASNTYFKATGENFGKSLTYC